MIFGITATGSRVIQSRAIVADEFGAGKKFSEFTADASKGFHGTGKLTVNDWGLP
jgi:hypothetical protein